MTTINLTEGYVTWSYNDDPLARRGLCKLIRIDRESIDEDCDEPDCWELLWIDSGNVRRFRKVLDPAFSRLRRSERNEVDEYLVGAPDEAVEIVDEMFALCDR